MFYFIGNIYVIEFQFSFTLDKLVLVQTKHEDVNLDI